MERTYLVCFKTQGREPETEEYILKEGEISCMRTFEKKVRDSLSYTRQYDFLEIYSWSLIEASK